MHHLLILNPPSPDNRKIIRSIECGFESKGNYLYQPLDLMQLTAIFRPPEWNISFLDCVATPELTSTITKQRAINYDLIIIAMSDICWSNDFFWLKRINDDFPTAQILVLGDCFYDSWIRQQVCGLADGIITSPWEINVQSIQNILQNHTADFSTLDGIIAPDCLLPASAKHARCLSISEPQHELFFSNKYRWPFNRSRRYSSVFTAYGCPFSCSYCLVSKSPLLYRPYQDVAAEIVNLTHKGIREIYFADRSFGFPVQNVKSLLQQLIDQNIKISWSCYFHPNFADRSLLQLFKNSGCHTLVIGVETTDQQLLMRYDRHTNLSKIEDFIKNCSELDIAVCCDFIIGFKDQTREQILKDIQWAIDHKIDYASFNILTPLSGTTIREEAERSGKLDPSTRHYDSLGGDNILASENLSSAEMLKLRNLATKKFYFRISYLLRRLQKTKSIEHFSIQLEEMFGIFFKH